MLLLLERSDASATVAARSSTELRKLLLLSFLPQLNTVDGHVREVDDDRRGDDVMVHVQVDVLLMVVVVLVRDGRRWIADRQREHGRRLVVVGTGCGGRGRRRTARRDGRLWQTTGWHVMERGRRRRWSRLRRMQGWRRPGRMMQLRRLLLLLLGNRQLIVELVMVRLGMMLRQIPVVSGRIMAGMFEACPGNVIRNRNRDRSRCGWCQSGHVGLQGALLFDYCRSDG